jgi:beta-1,2-mannobiose phosphorylase / 1,2-beta-oligomannan phosphorylase
VGGRRFDIEETQLKLERYANNPILAPILEHDWESRTVFNCGVAQDDGAVYLIYRAQGHESNVSRLGFAVSTDGYTFSRLDHCVFEPAAETETRGVEDPRLTKIGDRWHMLYTAWSEIGIQVAMASTANFFTWERHGIVLHGPDNKDAALFPEKINGHYVMFHRIPPDIWLAYSDDLIHWGDYQKIMQPRAGNWDGWKIGAGGPPLKTEHGWLAIYHGVSPDRVYRLGVVLLDLDDPSRVINWPAAPILEPERPWELTGDIPNVVFTCGTAEINGRYFVYYGGADKVIAVATADRADLIDFALHGTAYPST